MQANYEATDILYPLNKRGNQRVKLNSSAGFIPIICFKIILRGF